MASRFGLTPLQFAENLDWKRHDIIQDDEEPLKAAEHYVCQSFPTPEAVLTGAIHVVSKQLSREPKVRKLLRWRYRLRLKISVCPTKKGREEIDENHKLWPRRWLSVLFNILSVLAEIISLGDKLCSRTLQCNKIFNNLGTFVENQLQIYGMMNTYGMYK